MHLHSRSTRARAYIGCVIVAIPLLMSGCATNDAQPAEFVGSWRDGSGMTLVLNADGTGTLTHNGALDAQWTVSGDSIKKLCVGTRGAVGADCEVATIDGNVLTWGSHIMRR